MPENFNSRLRKETNIAEAKADEKNISNHVSFRRRTISASALAPSKTVKILIHVSARRWTPDSCSRNVFIVFQFTSPRGNEQCYTNSMLSTILFQFASTRGDEQYNRVIRDLRQVFQFTSPCGDEQKNPREFAPEKIFQITSPCGDEQEVKPSADFGWIFQLTSP